ncbi:tripartite tricarboxylate transporter permease [Chloroflexota bacterium]
MLEAFYQALATIAQPIVFLAILLASIGGVILGIIPGLQGGIGMVLVLPFMFGADPMIFLPVMATFTAVGATGGSITAILLGIPGTSSNVATTLDGFPMTRKGEGARAVGAGLTSSMLGGAVAVVFAFAMIPLVIPLIMRFRSPEMFFTIVVGLAFLAIIAKGSTMKGVISACLGLLISTIGYQLKTGLPRFTFGNLYLYNGVEMIVIVLGIFALPILIGLIVTGKTIAPLDRKTLGRYKDLFGGVRDVFHHWWLWFRCSAIGYVIGVIPGVGGETAIWVTYGHAKQSSKEPEKFGTGCVEGVIAPESANNSKDGGAMLTTLAFGIPGSGIMVLMLAAFLISGIQPGPNMLIEHTSLSFTLLLTIAIANIIAGVVCFFGIPYLTKLTRISPVYLFSFILPIIFIGIYTYNEAVLDILVLLFIAALGVLLGKFGYSMPVLVLGFILGGLAEYYFWHALDLHGPLFFMTPISLVMIFIVIFFLYRGAISSFLRRLLKPRTMRSS